MKLGSTVVQHKMIGIEDIIQNHPWVDESDLKQLEPKPQSNCKNCGAPLHGSRCEYCGTEYGSSPVLIMKNVDPEDLDNIKRMLATTGAVPVKGGTEVITL